MTIRLGLALLLLLASPALAQEVLVDAWSVKWASGRKAAWSHERIEAPKTGPLLYVARTWTPVGEGALVTREERVETDGAGKVQRYALTQKAPWGEVTARAEPAEGGLAYVAKVRGAAPREGRIEGEVLSPTVVMHLMLKGRIPAAKRTMKVVDLPGPGTTNATIEVKREGEGWRVQRKAQVEWFDARGGFVKTELPEQAAEMWLPAPSEEAARDLAAAAPASAPPALDVVDGPGVRVRRPGGGGWSVARTDKGGVRMVGLEHASGVTLFAMGLPVRFPKDEKSLLDLAEQMRGSMNSRATVLGEGPVLAPGAMSTWRERPAMRFEVGGTMDMATATGEVFLLDLDGRPVMIMTAAPADLAEVNAATLAQALAALEVVPGKAEEWERVQFEGASLELPVSWKEKTDGERVSPLGVSRVTVTPGAVPAGADMAQAQRTWLERNSHNPAHEEFHATRDEVMQVDGRSAHVVEYTARLKPRNGIQLHMRSSSCLSLQPDGTFVEVEVRAFDADLDLAAVDRILASVRWTKAP